MTKTRSQNLNLSIKEEDHKDELKLKGLLHDSNIRSSNTKNKITKNKGSKTRTVLERAAKVKVENIDDMVPASLPSIPTSRRPTITKEQVENLIKYIVKDKMGLSEASIKSKISCNAAYKYYQEYKNNLGLRMPLPKGKGDYQASRVTQAKVEVMFNYIIHDKMNPAQAARKANITRHTGSKYYKIYLNDPDRKIPMVANSSVYLSNYFTQEKINEFFGYIVNDNMSIIEASNKAGISRITGKKYYLKYLQDPNREIPNVGTLNYAKRQSYTNEQIKILIDYITVDKLSILESSVKANVSLNTAKKYYRKYLDDPNKKIPTPEEKTPCRSIKHSTLEQIKRFFSYIIIDKLTVPHASRKANISRGNGYAYYDKYLKDYTTEYKYTNNVYSVQKMEKLVEYIQNGNMSITAAIKKANLSSKIAFKYYRQYLKNPEDGFPEIQFSWHTCEDIKNLIDYIEHDKMTVCAAATKSNMHSHFGYKYYQQYKDDPEHKIPEPKPKGYQIKKNTFTKYSQIINDIYKDNPLIKPPQKNRHYNHVLTHVDIKQKYLVNHSKRRSKCKNN